MKIVKITFIALTSILMMSCEQKNESANATDNLEDDVVVATAEGHEGHEHEDIAEVATVDPAEAPVFTLEQTEFDFGDVEAGSKTEKVIEFTNTGKTPLLIQSAKASCGCTVPDYSKEPVAPGEKGQLTVAYTAPAINGSQNKTVTLNTNTAKSVETFRIKANVVGGNERQAPQPQQTPQNLPTPDLGNVN